MLCLLSPLEPNSFLLEKGFGVQESIQENISDDKEKMPQSRSTALPRHQKEGR